VLESIKWWVKKTFLSPKMIISMKHNRKAINDDSAMKIIGPSFILIGLFFIFILMTFFIFMHDPYFIANPVNTLFDIMSCVGNNGANTGMIGPFMPEYAKIIVIIEMWIAKLEIIPVMILIWGCIRGFNWEGLSRKSRK